MDILLDYFSCVTVQFFQGLGLLINLVEYSARNRHCLVNMETSCSFDSFCTGEGDDSLKITGQIDAVQALVQVRNDPKMCFSCKQYSFLLSEIQGRRKNSAVKNFARIYSVMHSENVKQHRGEEGCCLQLRFCSTILYRNSFLGKRWWCLLQTSRSCSVKLSHSYGVYCCAFKQL